VYGARAETFSLQTVLYLQQTADVARGHEVCVRLPDTIDLAGQQAIGHLRLQQVIRAGAAAAKVGFR